jgi:hypothetical protein
MKATGVAGPGRQRVTGGESAAMVTAIHGRNARCRRVLIELLNLVASIVLLNQPGQLSVNKIKELVRFIRVIPQLAHRRLAANDITNLSRSQRHRMTSGLFSDYLNSHPGPTAPRLV